MCNVCNAKLVLISVIYYIYISIINPFRNYWVHPFYHNRVEYGFENHILPSILNNELGSRDHISFQSFFRLPYEQFLNLCKLLSPILSQNQNSIRTDKITVSEKVAITLRYSI